MEENKENFDLEYLLYGEGKPGCLGWLIQTTIALLKYKFLPYQLTVGDGIRLKEIHDKTGIIFPLQSEKINRK